MTNNKSKCALCELMSKIPIRDSPSSRELHVIIECAKNRVQNNNCGKYKGCVKLSKCSLDDVTDISFHRSCFKDFTRKDLTDSSFCESNLTIEHYVSDYIERK